MQKRILSVFLALALTLTLLPPNAIALGSSPLETNQEVVSQENQGEIIVAASEMRAMENPQTSVARSEDWSALFAVTAPATKWIDRIDLSDNVKSLYTWLEEETKSGGILTQSVEKQEYLKTFNFNNGAKDLYCIPFEGWSTEEVNEAFTDGFQAVLDAFDRDHPEIFWLMDITKTGCVSSGNTFYITFENALYGDYSTKSDISEAIAADIASRDQQVSSITNGLSDKSRYDQVVALNDWLTKNNAYYNNGEGAASAPATSRKCLGALIGQYGLDGPVCEGYARAFQVLCDSLGIPCVLVDGPANGGGNPSDADGHMWNYVQMEDGNWYAVDVTWDDPTSSSSGTSSALSGLENQNYVLVGGTTSIDGKTFNQTHIVKNSPSTDAASGFLSNAPVLNDAAYRPKEPLSITVSVTVDGKNPSDKVDVNTVLTATVSSTPDGATFAYQWYRGETPITGATESTYTVTTADSDATLTVKVSDSSGSYSGTVESSNSVQVKKFLTADMVTISPKSFTYTGAEQKPAITVTDGATKLTDSDYTVEYSSDLVNVGTVKVTVTGQGDYGGIVEGSYEITKATPDLGTVSVNGTVYTTTPVSTINTMLNSTNTNLPAGTWALTGVGSYITESGTYNCTFTPTDTKNYNVATGKVSITVEERAISSISVTGTPTKTTYTHGDTFEHAGLTVTATYTDGGTGDVTTEAAYNNGKPLTAGQTTVTVTYGGKSAEISGITVNKIKLTVDTSFVNSFVFDGTEKTVKLTHEPTEHATVAYSGTTSATNVGSYTATATFTADTGYELVDGNGDSITSVTMDWSITPATMTGESITRNVKFDNTAAQTVTAADFGINIPGVSVALGTVPANTLLAEGMPKAENGSITFALAEGLTAPESETSVVIPVIFQANNYKDLELNLTVNVVAKNVPTLTVNNYTKTYDGRAVTMEDLADRLTAVFDGAAVAGTWAAVDTLPTDAGTYSCELTFTPEDAENFQTGLTRVISITIEKAPVTVTAESYTITVGSALPEYSYTVTGAEKEALGTITLSCDATTESGTGTYPITFAAKPELSNYDITWVDGVLTIQDMQTAAAPTASPASGTTFTDTLRVTLAVAGGAQIYYTLDGTAPTTASTLYEGPITLSETTTIKAIAVQTGMNNSAEAAFTYTKTAALPPVVDPDPQPPVVQTAATPVINPAGGVFYGTQQVVLTTATPGASIYYTTDGTNPTASSTLYTGTFILYNSAVVKAVAAAPGMNDSAVASAAFTRYTYTPSYPDPDPEPDDTYEPPVSSNPSNSQTSTPSTTQPSAPAQPVQQPVVPEVTTRPEAEVSGGTATAVVTPDAAEKLVEQAVSGRSDTVVIAPVIDGDAPRTEVTLPASAAGAIASQTNAELKVQTPAADIIIPNESLAGLGRTGGEIAVTAEKTADNAVEVGISVDGRRVDNVAIKAAIPAPCGPGTVAKIVDENGSVLSTVRKSSASSDGQTMNVPLSGSAKVIFVENAKAFADVPAANWAANAVAFASSHELMTGTSETAFEPTATMTRAMLAVVLHNLEGNPAAAAANSFQDVASSSWYSEAVQWAAGKGVINGVGEGVFAPNSPITREQLVLMLYRYVGQPAVSGGALGRFNDSASVSDWAEEAMNWAVSNGIVNGSNGVLNPQGSATRAEVAQMLMNFVFSGVL